MLDGGKRIRPRLVYAAGELADASPAALDHVAAAVEFIHAGSLVHDDLPAMDDDDLRRGKAALHARFGEATAILAGDALQAAAFAALGDAPASAGVVRRWLELLGEAIGAAGMAGGQALDLEGETRPLALAELETMHRGKTGGLIRAAVEMAACAGELSAPEVAALARFGEEIGLAFQIYDDVLDVTGETAALGKPQGADERRGKSTYVGLLGLDGARTAARRQLRLALDHLRPFGDRAQALVALAEGIVERSR